MKLRTLNCKNCDAPLRQENNKLVCQFCGSTFDIPMDSNDIEYDRIINAEDYIRLSLAKNILGLEKKYSDQALLNQIKRERDSKMRRERMIKGLTKAFISMAAVMLVMLVITVVVLKVSNNNKERKKEQAQVVEVWNPGYRITPSDLRADKEFKELIDGGMIADERSGYDDRGAIIFSSDEIWNISKDPEIIGRYLITEEGSNMLITVYKITFETNDGRVKEMYDCQAYENLTIDENGKIVYSRKDGKNTDDYDFRFHADPELEPIMEQYIDCNFNVRSIYIFEF
ncbi:MAG: hypothetical protein K6G47_01560 [Clostridia bacterium]|nr:hypothetical protein [Clostridia bacterium]